MIKNDKSPISMHNEHMITKTDLLIYMDTPLHLWAMKHNQLDPDIKPSRYDLYLQEQGYKIEALAKDFLEQKFPAERYTVDTQRTVVDGDFFARLDGLVYDKETGTYDVYEIKSATSVKRSNQYDLVFQYLVAATDLPIKDIFLLHVNKTYLSTDALNLTDFFQIENGNVWIAEIGDEVHSLREAALKVAQSKIADGIKDCTKPSACPCPALCHPALPPNPIYNLPRLNKKKARELKAQGILAIQDIPKDFKLSANQRLQADAVLAAKPYIDLPSITEALNKLQYPLYFLDYETYNPGVPMFAGYRPFQHIVFQCSLHILDKPDKELKHYEFVSSNDQDPGMQVAAHLAQHIGSTGSVIVWNKSFEAGRNKELAEMYPAYRDMLLNVNDRVFDLMEIFRKNHYIDPDFHGSFSIKYVLPVLVKEFAQEYEKLPIPKGDEAMMAWFEMMTEDYTKEQKQKIIRDLLDYCELDTLAMVKIWEVLVKLVQP